MGDYFIFLLFILDFDSFFLYFFEKKIGVVKCPHAWPRWTVQVHASAGMNIAPAFGGGGAQWWSTNLLDLNDVHAIDVEARSVPVSAKQNLRPTFIHVLISCVGKLGSI